MGTFLKGAGSSSVVRILLIMVMVLLFLIPLNMVADLMKDRNHRASATAEEVINGVGGRLEFIGPLFIIPYTSAKIDYLGITRTTQNELYVLPDTFLADGIMTAEYLSRGIYRIPVYKTKLELAGTVTLPSPEAFPQDVIVLNDEVRMVTGIRDMFGIRNTTDFIWETGQYPFKPEVGNSFIESGLAVTGLSLPTDRQSVEFSWTMEIDGGDSVSFLPLGRDSELLLEGNWPSPSFQGARLPDTRSWDSDGFQAQWRIPEVSRSIQPYWNSDDDTQANLRDHLIRIELLETVDSYRQALRSVRYGILFLLIPFAVFLFAEFSSKVKFHPLQYFLAGAANIVFFVLLLALSEHWGFDPAYLTASTAVTLLLVFHAGNLTKKRTLGWVMLPVLAGAWLWLWVSLQSEDYALLIGAIGLFVITALMMVLARKINLTEDQSEA